MKNQTVAIIGGAGPLGRSASRIFLEAGANLVIGWNSEETWREAEELLLPYRGRYTSVRVDVTDETSVERFVDTAVKAYGGIDVLLYMAGAFNIGPMLWETDTAVFDKMLAVNLRGAFLSVKHTVPVMLPKNKGHIFLFPAKSVVSAKSRFSAYATSKGALLTMMDGLCEELKDTDISVNAVMPDAMDTWKTRKAPNATPEKWVSTDSVAELVLSICSMEGNILNGATLKIFGK